jgi:hypothetical protein
VKLTKILYIFKLLKDLYSSIEKSLMFFSRDFRLSNLTDEQVEICQYWTELAADLLQDGYKKAHIAALSRVAIVLEINQSRKGFLRKTMNTLRQESTHQELQPAKKSFFGGNKGVK